MSGRTPFIPLRVPKLFDLWSDPFERADHESSYYTDWRARRAFLLVPAQAFVGQSASSSAGVTAPCCREPTNSFGWHRG